MENESIEKDTQEAGYKAIKQKTAVFFVNFVGVLFGFLVLALTAVKAEDFKDVLFELQICFFVSIVFLFLCIILCFFIIIDFNLIEPLFNFIIDPHIKRGSLFSKHIIRFTDPFYFDFLINCVYICFCFGLLFVSLVVVLMVFKSLLWVVVFLISIIILFVFILRVFKIYFMKRVRDRKAIKKK